MTKSRPAAGGGHWVVVSPERLDGWLGRFAARHGGLRSCDPGRSSVGVTATDGALAECLVPFGPLRVRAGAAYGGLVAHAVAERRVAVLLVRVSGHAVGVFEGSRLVSSKVGSGQVQGRGGAGGSSERRFARRREGQARVALAAAAETAASHLLPALGTVGALVVGGERRAVEQVLADPRLALLRPLLVEPHLDVGDPNRSVLEQTPKQFRAVRIHVVEPVSASGPQGADRHGRPCR